VPNESSQHPEIARIKAAIQAWDSYAVYADRRWLQPLINALFEGFSGTNIGPQMRE